MSGDCRVHSYLLLTTATIVMMRAAMEQKKPIKGFNHDGCGFSGPPQLASPINWHCHPFSAVRLFRCDLVGMDCAARAHSCTSMVHEAKGSTGAKFWLTYVMTLCEASK